MTDFEETQWNSFLIHMFNNWSESINDWSESNKFMNLYLKEILSRDAQYKSSLQNSPILEFILYGNKEMVEYISYSQGYVMIGTVRPDLSKMPYENIWILIHIFSKIAVYS